MSIIMLLIGLASPLLALAWAVVVFARSEKGRTVPGSFLVYLGTLVGVALIAVFVVAVLGRVLCGLLRFPEESCGWVASFFLTPLLASICVISYAHAWAKRTDAL